MAVGFYPSSSAATVTWTNWASTSNSTWVSTNNTWGAWTSIGTATADSFVTGTFYSERAETDEEREERDRRRAEERAAREAEDERIRARAEETLALVLDPEQLEDWRRTDSFRLITQAGREYKIRRGVAGNVQLIEDGEVAESLCCHPVGVPREDVVIAQVLALRTDEESFRRTANITSRRRVA